MNSAHSYSEGAEVPEDKTTDNELIARFMGQHITLPGLRRNVMVKSYYADELKYDSDWSWLMPVVEKIEGLHATVSIGIGNNCAITMLRLNDDNRTVKEVIPITDTIGIDGETKIEAVYKAVVQFIKWNNRIT